jgi:ATP-dependent helicase HrpB
VRSAPLFVCLSIGTAGGGASAAGRETAVHSASAVEEAWLDTRTEEAATLDEASGRVTLRRRRLYRDLVLDEVELGPAPAERAAPLLARWALRDPRRGLGLDRDEIASFLARLGCLREWRPDLALPDLGLPDLGYRDLVPAAAERAAPAPTLPAALDALAPAWSGVLEAAVAGARSTADVARAPVLDLLRGSISWELLQKLDELAPERIALPNGRTAAIRYELGSSPVLAARIQDLFGWRETPRIAGGRVPLLLHLLAPNFRPQQVTDDLAGFWQRTYPMVRKELAGRYPKHAWPADGAAAEPVKGPGRRSRG